jgi:hypothetical protein
MFPVEDTATQFRSGRRLAADGGTSGYCHTTRSDDWDAGANVSGTSAASTTGEGVDTREGRSVRDCFGDDGGSEARGGAVGGGVGGAFGGARSATGGGSAGFDFGFDFLVFCGVSCGFLGSAGGAAGVGGAAEAGCGGVAATGVGARGPGAGMGCIGVCGDCDIGA